jgi:hypothetical protein
MEPCIFHIWSKSKIHEYWRLPWMCPVRCCCGWSTTRWLGWMDSKSKILLTSLCKCIQKAWIESMYTSDLIQIQNPWSIDDYRECAWIGAVVYDPLLDGLSECIASQKYCWRLFAYAFRRSDGRLLLKVFLLIHWLCYDHTAVSHCIGTWFYRHWIRHCPL